MNATPRICTAFQTAADEQVLVERLRARDVTALKEVYFRYHGLLSRFLLNVTAQPPLVISDLVNDVMMAVWEQALTFDQTSSLSTWIVSIACDKASDIMREGQG
jgi:RNA polymerase sigma-70 factor (ECF subfamily)